MAKKAAPKKKKQAAKSKSKAKKVVAKKTAKPSAKPKAKSKAKSAPKKKAKPIAKAKAKPVPKKAAGKPTQKAKSKAAAKSKPAAKQQKALKKAAPKAHEATPATQTSVFYTQPVVVTKPLKKSEEQAKEEEARLIERVNKTPLVNFRKREVSATQHAMEQVLPEEANRVRYSDKELAEFRKIIMKKLEAANKEYNNLLQQMINANEHGTDDTGGTFKMLEEGSENLAKEEAGQLAARQKKFIDQLEAALARIENKTYGVCIVTGKLIPKERLRAVPHTTKSIEAKLNQYRD